jgi:hypothetical protein
VIPRRLFAFLAGLGAAAVLAGCTMQTDPATDITPTSARLNGTITVSQHPGSGEYWFEYSGDNGATWTQLPHRPWGTPGDCNFSGSESGPIPVHEDVSGLIPGRHYIFRTAATICGGSSVIYGDSNWTSGSDSDPPYEYDSFTTPGLLASDPMTNPDPLPLWKSIDCGSSYQNPDPTRVSWHSSGGPGNGPYRTMSILAGDTWDDASDSRCELGRNEQGNSFAEFHQGEHRIIAYWLRMPTARGFDAYRNAWQEVSQFKQEQPYCQDLSYDQGGGVAIEHMVYGGNFTFSLMWGHVGWSTQVGPLLDKWILLRHDILFSDDPNVGTAQLTISDGQGQVLAQSPTLHYRTLTDELQSGSNCNPTGPGPIPDHLRIGLYHNSVYGPAQVDYGPVQVYSAP